MNKAITVTPLVIGDDWYYLHARRVPEGVDGYVIKDGEFVTTVPLCANERELFSEAGRQIRRARSTDGLHH